MTDRLTATEQVARWMIANGYATGHGDDVDDLLRHLVQEVRDQALRAALAEPEAEQEPVAYLYTYHGAEGWGDKLEFPGCRWQGPGYNHMPNNWRETPLYAHPPRREWQSLTEKAIADIVDDMNGNEPTAPFWRDLARAIESALKEKNHVRD